VLRLQGPLESVSVVLSASPAEYPVGQSGAPAYPSVRAAALLRGGVLSDRLKSALL